LTIPNGDTSVQLKTIPTWFEKLKYKLCGFECKIIRQKPYASPVNFNDANKSLIHHPYGDKKAGSEDITGEDLDVIIKELEAETR
jgi:hypothetical protein